MYIHSKKTCSLIFVTLFLGLTACGTADNTDDMGYSHPASNPVVDLVPRSIGFSDTVKASNTPIQRVHIQIENIGQGPVVRPQIHILFNNRAYIARLIGPGGAVGAPIGPGQRGTAQFDVAIGVVNHCQKVQGQIDLKRDLQSGSISVFNNDGLGSLFAIKSDSLRVCIDPVIHR